MCYSKYLRVDTTSRHRGTKQVPLCLSTSGLADEEGSDSPPGVGEMKLSTTAFPELFPTIEVTKKVGCETHFPTSKLLTLERHPFCSQYKPFYDHTHIQMGYHTWSLWTSSRVFVLYAVSLNWFCEESESELRKVSPGKSNQTDNSA